MGKGERKAAVIPRAKRDESGQRENNPKNSGKGIQLKAFAGYCKKIMEDKAKEEKRREAEGEDEEEELGLEMALESGDYRIMSNL